MVFLYMMGSGGGGGVDVWRKQKDMKIIIDCGDVQVIKMCIYNFENNNNNKFD